MRNYCAYCQQRATQGNCTNVHITIDSLYRALERVAEAAEEYEADTGICMPSGDKLREALTELRRVREKGGKDGSRFGKDIDMDKAERDAREIMSASYKGPGVGWTPHDIQQHLATALRARDEEIARLKENHQHMLDGPLTTAQRECHQLREEIARLKENDALIRDPEVRKFIDERDQLRAERDACVEALNEH